MNGIPFVCMVENMSCLFRDHYGTTMGHLWDITKIFVSSIISDFRANQFHFTILVYMERISNLTS